MPSASHTAHEGLPFANPMSQPAVDRALAAVRLPEGARILETGSGAGELLLRMLERDRTWSGLGVDVDPDAVAEAGRRAERRLPGREVRFEARDAAPVTGTYDAVVNVASSHVHGGFPNALTALRGLLRPGGTLLYGEGYWAVSPTAEFLEALGGATEDELPDLDGLRAAVVAAGFAVVHEELASEDDWAGYEHALVAGAERDGGVDTARYAERIRVRRALPGGGSTLGFALFVLRAHGA